MGEIIKIEKLALKSIYDDYEMWLEKLEEIEKNISFLRTSFKAMLMERDEVLKEHGG